MRLGLYGGTFDPPHVGHGEIVATATKSNLFDKLLVLPSGNPPHKNGSTDMRYRFDMARIAFSGSATVSDYEMNAERSYTVLTARHFFEETGEKNVLVLGGDSFRDFFLWYKPQEILTYCDLAVFPRTGVDYGKTFEKLAPYGTTVYFFDKKITDVSSTRLKTDLRFGMDVTGRVDEKVIAYIKENGLYREYTSIIERLRQALKPSRFAHTYRVVLKGMEMNAKEKLDGEKVFLACLLHDCAKYMTPAECGFVPPEGMPEAVYHAFEGSIVAKRDYGVNDEEVLDAIRYHCTGCDDMKPLEMLVYVADYIEDGRGPFANPIREIYEKNGLTAAYIAAKRATRNFLAGNGRDSFECRRNEIK